MTFDEKASVADRRINNLTITHGGRRDKTSHVLFPEPRRFSPHTADRRPNDDGRRGESATGWKRKQRTIVVFLSSFATRHRRPFIRPFNDSERPQKRADLGTTNAAGVTTAGRSVLRLVLQVLRETDVVFIAVSVSKRGVSYAVFERWCFEFRTRRTLVYIDRTRPRFRSFCIHDDDPMPHPSRTSPEDDARRCSRPGKG